MSPNYSSLWEKEGSARELIEYIEGELLAGRFDRKLRLSLCAIADRVAPIDGTETAARLVRLSELFADGGYRYTDLLAEALHSDHLYPTANRSAAAWALATARMLQFDPARVNVKFDTAYYTLNFAWAAVGSDHLDAEDLAQGALIKDIFGNPFRPVAFSSAWRTDTAVSLARMMYESREFGAMPILADALQDAGCDTADILDHCRGPGSHVRGCWVVDLVLGKE